MTVEVTNISSKGQIVIPQKIREQMHLSQGLKLMILTDGENLLLKPVTVPKLETFRSLIKESRSLAREKNLKKSDLLKAIQTVRHAHHH